MFFLVAQGQMWYFPNFLYLGAGVHGEERRWQNSRCGWDVEDKAFTLLGHFGQQEKRHASDGQNIAVHQSCAKGSRIGKIAKEFRIIIGHAYIVDQYTNIQVLQLCTNAVIDFPSAGEVHVYNASLDSVLGFCIDKSTHTN